MLSSMNQSKVQLTLGDDEGELSAEENNYKMK